MPTDWNAALPSGGISFRRGDDDIRKNNAALEDALSREHTFPGDQGTTAGRHAFGMGTTATRDLTILTPEAGNIWFNTTLGIWQIYNGTSWSSVGEHVADTMFTGRVVWDGVSTVRIERGIGSEIHVEIDHVVLASDVDISFVMASHLDAAEAPSTIYYFYVENLAGVITPHISATPPVTNPASGKVGYHPVSTGWRFIVAAYNNASSNLVAFDWRSDGTVILRTRALTAIPLGTTSASNPTFASASLAGRVPANAREALCEIVAARVDSLNLYYAPSDAAGQTLSAYGSPSRSISGDTHVDEGSDRNRHFWMPILDLSAPAITWAAAVISAPAVELTVHTAHVVGWR